MHFSPSQLCVVMFFKTTLQRSVGSINSEFAADFLLQILRLCVHCAVLTKVLVFWVF